MQIVITKEMKEKAIKNTDEKLSKNRQLKRVYSKTAGKDAYYINNIIGELGELAFEKAVLESGYILGTSFSHFDTFLNSDICDFISSKTAKAIDVKTSCTLRYQNLLINKKVADWKSTPIYVLVRLYPLPKRQHTMESFWEINSATMSGWQLFEDVKSKGEVVNFYQSEAYLVENRNLKSIHSLFKTHFLKKGERIPRYLSKGKAEFHIASLEKGAVSNTPENEDINKIAKKYLDKGIGDGFYNFYLMWIKESNKLVAFPVFKGKLYTALLIKALLLAEVRCRNKEQTLVIPAYIENHIPKTDLPRVIEVIENMKCHVEYTWSNKKYF